MKQRGGTTGRGQGQLKINITKKEKKQLICVWSLAYFDNYNKYTCNTKGTIISVTFNVDKHDHMGHVIIIWTMYSSCLVIFKKIIPFNMHDIKINDH